MIAQEVPDHAVPGTYLIPGTVYLIAFFPWFLTGPLGYQYLPGYDSTRLINVFMPRGVPAWGVLADKLCIIAVHCFGKSANLYLVCPRNSIRSLDGKTDKAGLIETFHAHERRVKHTVPAERLLVFQASDGWAPLCAFLGKTVPTKPYPRSNSREEFFELLAQGPTN